MASTVFQDYNQNNPIVSAWLNDVNNAAYSTAGIPKKAVLMATAWVRFSVTGGVVTIQQSENIASVVRNGAGVFTVTYGAALTNAFNGYSITQNAAGFAFAGAETTTTIVVNTTNTSNVATDPGSCTVLIFGEN